MPPSIAAGALRLERWSLDRLDQLLDAIEVSLPALRPWMPWAQAMPTREAQRDTVEEFASRFDRGEDYPYFMIEDDGDELVGCAGLHPQGLDRVEIGYWVRSDRHRRGYATAASRALTDAAFAHLDGVAEVVIHMDKANVASAAVPPKLGFEFRGEEPWDRDLTPGDAGVLLTWAMPRPG